MREAIEAEEKVGEARVTHLLYKIGLYLNIFLLGFSRHIALGLSVTLLFHFSVVVFFWKHLL